MMGILLIVSGLQGLTRGVLIVDVTLPPYSAVGDNMTLNTESLQSALDFVGDSCAGGVVKFPADSGTFLTGALFLRSNTTLEIGDNVTLQAVAPTEWLDEELDNTTTWTHFPPVYVPDLQQDVGGFTHAALLNGAVCEEVSEDPSAYGDQCLRWRTVENVTITGRGGGGARNSRSGAHALSPSNVYR